MPFGVALWVVFEQRLLKEVAGGYHLFDDTILYWSCEIMSFVDTWAQFNNQKTIRTYQFQMPLVMLSCCCLLIILLTFLLLGTWSSMSLANTLWMISSALILGCSDSSAPLSDFEALVSKSAIQWVFGSLLASEIWLMCCADTGASSEAWLRWSLRWRVTTLQTIILVRTRIIIDIRTIKVIYAEVNPSLDIVLGRFYYYQHTIPSFLAPQLKKNAKTIEIRKRIFSYANFNS